jgi:uracil-DNA glycosylase
VTKSTIGESARVQIDMILDDLWALFCDELFPVPSTPSLFNPYKDNEPGVDLPDGDEIRRENLLNYLRSFTNVPPVVIIGEAPGWRGCRFSGVPFTSESQLLHHTVPFHGRRSALRSSPYTEATATIFWRHLSPVQTRFFAWNCVPFHPREEGESRSNRTPSRAEIDSYSDFLRDMLSLLRPERLIALGRSAERALNGSDIPSVYVRHPSRGGARAFREGIEPLFKAHMLPVQGD